MSDFTTAARPYAKAVFELARDAGNYAKWSEQLALIATVASDAQMRVALDAPGLSNDRRAQMIISVCGEHIDQLACNFLQVIAENARLPLLVDIAALYEVYRAAAEEVTEATVVSARELGDQQQAAIIAALSKRLGGQVNLHCQIDESLLGGAVIRAGDMVIDGSVRGRLDKLAYQLGAHQTGAH